MWAPQNRDVAGLVFIKASGSLVWGASDVLYVRCAGVLAADPISSSCSSQQGSRP